jgi:hypothetical protein
VRAPPDGGNVERRGSTPLAARAGRAPAATAAEGGAVVGVSVASMMVVATKGLVEEGGAEEVVVPLV